VTLKIGRSLASGVAAAALLSGRSLLTFFAPPIGVVSGL
jgi:hypothetical protein